ncbi:MAG TPA: DUF3098 domain-containing protein [Candidatus Marinimicrobia bacterium]|nr:DUF3098 domain-containing protein [Candidatus Neomarinimicrobiota bacterium]HIB96380.1 DUF3098 domain-containing protein [Candidatus Neomarinimicrobiota bacterium]HIN61246.1 DUF3098 domain-containing protein [Candidatus Neomarinimicrobiota bacterium]
MFAPAVAKKNEKSEIHLFEGWAFGNKNYLLFSIGLVTIISGYIVMATGDVNSFQSLTLSPIMLFVGYLVIIPLALVVKDNDRKSPSTLEN